MNLEESIRHWVINSLPYDASDTEIVQKLHAEDAHGLLVIYHNWCNRLVRRIPRQIKESYAFRASPHRERFSIALSAIASDVRKGNDLTKYLSRGVRVALKLPSRSRGGSDRDMLLNDWGVHHLHLSKVLQSDGFVQRTGPLLFARFERDTAYFLYLADHGQWTKKAIASVFVDEFPEAGGANEVKGALGVSREIDDDEHQKLRSAGINAIRMIGDKAVAGGGYNLQGYTLRAVTEADRILEKAKKFEYEWKNNEKGLRAYLEEQGAELQADTSFEFAIDEKGPLIVETVSRTALRVFSY